MIRLRYLRGDELLENRCVHCAGKFKTVETSRLIQLRFGQT